MSILPGDGIITGAPDGVIIHIGHGTDGIHRGIIPHGHSIGMSVRHGLGGPHGVGVGPRHGVLVGAGIGAGEVPVGEVP